MQNGKILKAIFEMKKEAAGWQKTGNVKIGSQKFKAYEIDELRPRFAELCQKHKVIYLPISAEIDGGNPGISTDSARSLVRMEIKGRLLHIDDGSFVDIGHAGAGPTTGHLAGGIAGTMAWKQMIVWLLDISGAEIDPEVVDDNGKIDNSRKNGGGNGNGGRTTTRETTEKKEENTGTNGQEKYPWGTFPVKVPIHGTSSAVLPGTRVSTYSAAKLNIVLNSLHFMGVDAHKNKLGKAEIQEINDMKTFCLWQMQQYWKKGKLDHHQEKDFVKHFYQTYVTDKELWKEFSEIVEKIFGKVEDYEKAKRNSISFNKQVEAEPFFYGCPYQLIETPWLHKLRYLYENDDSRKYEKDLDEICRIIEERKGEDSDQSEMFQEEQAF